MDNRAKKPLAIIDQGSFTAGGSILQTPGPYNFDKPLEPSGQTLHGDHAYVNYQIPVDAKKYPLIFLHGAGQSAKTWETTADGREGFNNIFLRRGFSIYLVDQPRRGRAGRSTVPADIPNATDDQLWFNTFRIGHWPKIYENVKFPRGKEALDNFFRQMTPNTGNFDTNVISDAVAAVFEKTGNGILISHSQGAGPGWLTAIKSKHVKAVVCYEPGSGFVFPEGETPKPLESLSPFGPLSAESIPMNDFMKLTEKPIVIYYGDNIPEEKTQEWNKDHWRVRLEMAKMWVETINRYGGDASVVQLPELGITGGTHFLFADENNIEVADVMEKWLDEKRLTN